MQGLIFLVDYLRVSTILFSVLLLYFLFKFEKNKLTKLYSTLLLVSTIGFLGAYWSPIQAFPFLFFSLFLFSTLLPFAFYLFTRHIFSDENRPLGNLKYVLLGGSIITSLLYFITFKYPHAVLLNIAFLISLLALIMAGYEAVSTFRTDLINSRRVRRILVVVFVVVFGMIALFSFYTYEPLSLPPILNCILIFLQLYALHIFFPISIIYKDVSIGEKVKTKTGVAEKVEDSNPPRDLIVEKIHTRIILPKKYRTESLTISKLSELIEEKEYLVRKAINTKMGFSNFNQFLNHYRIADAKHILQEDKNITMKEIAFLLGYSTPSSFNRVFKQIEGQTPSAYKQSLRV